MRKLLLVVICTLMPPTKAAVLSAIDRAEQSLKHYQLTIGKFNDMPEVAATVQKDSEAIVVGGMAVILLRTKLSQGQDIDPLELATLFANTDAAAINAALTSLSLAANTTPSKSGLRKAEAAKALIGNAQELKESSDGLWAILEAYLKSQKAWRVAVLLPQGTNAGAEEGRSID